MGKKIIAVLLVFLCMVFSLSGCFGKTKADKDFSIPITDEPRSLDPQIAAANAERLIAVNGYEGLVCVGADGNILPGVAESYTVSADGCVYTFTLRQDAHWAMMSAQKLTLEKTYGEDFKEKFDKTVYAEDFVFALQRAVDPQTDSADAFLFSAIENAPRILAGELPREALGVTAKDAYTVEIRLAQPDDNLLYALCAPAAMPCDREFFELTAGRYGLEVGYTLSNGPLHIASWSEKTSLKMRKNSDYNGERAACPASLTLYYNKDAAEIPEKVDNGAYDAAFLSLSQFEALENAKDFTVQYLENTTYSFLFNCYAAPFSNVHLRKALCMAFDTQKLSVLGAVEPAAGLIPPYCKVGTEPYRSLSDAAGLPYDPNAAAELLAEGLLELGKNVAEVEVLCTEPYADFVRETVQGWQRALGVKFVASVRVLAESELAAAVADQNYAVAFCPITADTESAAGFLEMFSANGVHAFPSAAYESALQTVRKNAGRFAAQLSACAEAESLLLSEAAALPVFTQNNCFVTAKDTKGIYFYGAKDYVYFIEATKK